MNLCTDDLLRLRIGHGIDAHAFEAGRKLILGGVEFEGHAGLAGHSDADVCTHALMDALLSAAGMGDIGRMFPVSDAKYKDADSLVLLGDVCRRLAAAGYILINADVIIVCESPVIAPHSTDMRTKMAEHMQDICRDDANLSIKGTTMEKMGFTGREEGILATATCLLLKTNKSLFNGNEK